MKNSTKRLLVQVGSFTLGAGLIAANGVYVFTKNKPHLTHNVPIVQTSGMEDGITEVSAQVVEQINASAKNRVEANTVRTLSASDVSLPGGSTMTKASINDYDLTIKIDTKKTKEEIEYENRYDASYDIDSTVIYDPHPTPLNYTETRDVSAEFYTIHDIISGNDYTMNAHELLCQMVYSEIGSSWDDDAIKAQIVAAYSYLRFNDSINRIPDVGLKPDYPSKIENCVKAVEGQAVYYDNEIINAVYSASTAGYSVESERIWDVYYPYLRAVVSKFDCEDPNYGLLNEYSYSELKSILEGALNIKMSDNVDNWFVVDDIYSGRYVGYITIDGQKRITARTLQDTLDLKSQAFTIKIEDNKIKIYTFGWGHGVGMSQWGACHYAANGYKYDQILRHYYLNTDIRVSEANKKAVRRGSAFLTPSKDSDD